MYKVFIVAAFIAVTCGRPQHKDAHAISSQSIVLHTDHGHEGQNTHGLIQLQQGSQQHNNQHEEHHVDYYAHPQYAFEYKIQDPHTGDNKYQHETRDGDVVKGVYSLHEADGTIRIVEYSADKHSGFNAIVKQEGHAQHIQPKQQQYHN